MSEHDDQAALLQAALASRRHRTAKMPLPETFQATSTGRQIGVNLTLFSSAAQIHGLRHLRDLKRAVGSYSDLAVFVTAYHPAARPTPHTRQYMQMMVSGRCSIPAGMREAFQSAIERAIVAASDGAWMPTARVTSRGTVCVTLRRLCRDCGKPFVVQRGTDRRCGRCRS